MPPARRALVLALYAGSLCWAPGRVAAIRTCAPPDAEAEEFDLLRHPSELVASLSEDLDLLRHPSELVASLGEALVLPLNGSLLGALRPGSFSGMQLPAPRALDSKEDLSMPLLFGLALFGVLCAVSVAARLAWSWSRSEPPCCGTESDEGCFGLLGVLSWQSVLLVLVSDFLVLLLLSAGGLGPQVYSGVASDRANTAGTVAALALVLSLAASFVLDVLRRGPFVQAVVAALHVAVSSVAVFLKGISYPWAPVALCICIAVVLIASQRQRLVVDGRADLKRFYQGASVAFVVCGVLTLAVWAGWLHFYGRGWSPSTRRWLVAENMEVYEYLLPKLDLGAVLGCDPDREPGSYSDLKDRPLTTECQQMLAETTGARRRAEAVWFLEWSCPLLAVACNFLCAGACFAFSLVVMQEAADEVAAKKIFLRFARGLALSVALVFGVTYGAVCVAGATQELSSATLALGAAGSLASLAWVLWEADEELIGEMLKSPGWKSLSAFLRSDWVRAIAVAGLNILVPLLMGLDMVRQRVRRRSGYYGAEGAGYAGAAGRGAASDTFTPEGRRLVDFLRQWHWTGVFGKVCVLAEVFVALTVGVKLTFVMLACLNEWIGRLDLGMLPLSLMAFAVDVAMFVCPICPGAAVYIFTGVVLGHCALRPGSCGLAVGFAVACGAAFAAKIAGTLMQYGIGFAAGRSVRVQRMVGVDQVPVRAAERLLSERGVPLPKVCLLTAGPDWPTSVLCGILRINIFQMLLGTVPVLPLAVAPMTLVGVLLVKKDGAGMLELISVATQGLAVVLSAGGTLAYTHFILQVVEREGPELAKEREEHRAVAELHKSEEAYEQKYLEVSNWDALDLPQRAAILAAAALLVMSGWLLVADSMLADADKLCFRTFAITGRVADKYQLGGLEGSVVNLVVAPLGWVALGSAAAAVATHAAFLRWAAAATQRELAAEAGFSRLGSARREKPKGGVLAPGPGGRAELPG